MSEHRKSSLRGAVRAVADEKRQALGGEVLTGEILDAYFRDQLDEAERQEVARQIALDPALAAGVLAKRREPGEQQAQIRQREEDWRALVDRADQESLTLESDRTPTSAPLRARTPLPGAPPTTARAASDPYGGNRRLMALAAGWLVTALALGLVSYRLLTREHTGTISLGSERPSLETNVLAWTLDPDTLRRSADGATPRLRVDANTERLVLFLTSDHLRPFHRYSAALHTDDGTLLISHPNVRRAADGSFTVALGPELLAAGRYELVLSGHTDDAREEIGRYAFHIATPSA